MNALYNRLAAIFNAAPWSYYVTHAIIALLIAGAVTGLLTLAPFVWVAYNACLVVMLVAYIAREMEKETGLLFDGWWIGPATVLGGLLAAVVFRVTHQPLAVGLLCGALAYVVRELRDRQRLGYWDWPGLMAPTLVCIAIWLILK